MNGIAVENQSVHLIGY